MEMTLTSGMLEHLRVNLAFQVISLESLNNKVVRVISISSHLLLEHLDHVIIGAGTTNLTEEVIKLRLSHQDTNVVKSSAKIILVNGSILVDVQEEGRVEMISTDIITHEKYNSFNLHNDIGLIHLPEKVNLTDILKPVCLPSHSEEDERWAGEDCQASGWGKPSDSADSISPVLREVTVDTITNLICALQFPTIMATDT